MWHDERWRWQSLIKEDIAQIPIPWPPIYYNGPCIALIPRLSCVSAKSACCAAAQKISEDYSSLKVFFLIYLFFLCLLAAFPACTSPFIIPESERWQKCLTECHLSVINKDVYVHCALVQACCHGKHVPLERLIADIKLRCSVAHDK